GAHDRLFIDRQAADAEDEQVDRVGQQRQPDQHLEGTRTQHQPDAGAGHDADGQGDDQLHQWLPSPACCSVVACRRWARSDWWAIAVSSSSVAPTTTVKTPRSNRMALGTCTSPTSGQTTCAVCVVRNG